ncbi:hypothetical protein [Bacillus sp. S3]|uniref:hypothetical protein n=1 Tax=Bacillus sp. S3 TaxID=486398 RepID=UPI001680A629|nr:hypothetical protein [Bacillus sp. S3]
MKTYVVKYTQHEKVFTDLQFAIKEAEILSKTGVHTYVYSEIDGVRDEEPFYSCTWEI